MLNVLTNLIPLPAADSDYSVMSAFDCDPTDLLPVSLLHTVGGRVQGDCVSRFNIFKEYILVPSAEILTLTKNERFEYQLLD